MVHAIVLLHGMGKYGTIDAGRYVPDIEGWLSRQQSFLSDQFEAFVRPTFNIAKGTPKPFKVIGINYDGTFEKFRHAWATQAATWPKLNSQISDTNLVDGSGIANLVGKLQELFSGVGNANNFAWTHLADVALYLLPLVRNQVQTDVRRTIGRQLHRVFQSGECDSWSLVGHSLGTLVANDFLHDFSSASFAQQFNTIRPPRVACMLSNVSQLLTRDERDLYADHIKPGARRGASWFMTFAHQLDVLAQLEPFNAPWTKNYIADNGLSKIYPRSLINGDGYASEDWGKTLKRLGGLPHEFSHYMKQPRVCASFWTRVLSRPQYQDDLETAAEAHYASELSSDLRQILSIEARNFMHDWKTEPYFANGLTLKVLRDAIRRGLT